MLSHCRHRRHGTNTATPFLFIYSATLLIYRNILLDYTLTLLINSFTLLICRSHTPNTFPMSQNIYWYNDPATCATVDATGESIVGSKLKLGTFLFNGSAIINPLRTISAAPAAEIVRQAMYTSLCGLMCGNNVLGYNYCHYRDCTWSSGYPFSCIIICSHNSNRCSYS